MEKLFLELMMEESPVERSGSFDSVEEAIARLKEGRSGCNSEVERSLVPYLDDAIGKLEQWLSDPEKDRASVADAIKLIGQGLSALSAIQKIISLWKGM